MDWRFESPAKGEKARFSFPARFALLQRIKSFVILCDLLPRLSQRTLKYVSNYGK
jgi:hypothetical protein